MAQAKARNVTPRVIVVDHPIGGLNAEELAGRIAVASAGVKQAVGV